MKAYIKKIVLKFIKKIIFFSRDKNILRTILDMIVSENNKNFKTLSLKNKKIYFFETNAMTKFRNDTFFEKEPETLNWINSFEKSSNFWDIGANVGIYSIYAAITKNCNVSAFEPSVFNLELLAKNIYLNSLVNQISIFPIILSDKQSIGTFNNSSLTNGAALSSLMEDDQVSNELNSKCIYKMPVLQLDKVCQIYNIKKPKYLKIDVDGLEYNIIKGGRSILKSLKSLLIEIDNEQPKNRNNIFKILKTEGFYLEANNTITADTKTTNQIWHKNS